MAKLAYTPLWSVIQHNQLVKRVKLRDKNLRLWQLANSVGDRLVSNSLICASAMIGCLFHGSNDLPVGERRALALALCAS